MTDLALAKTHFEQGSALMTEAQYAQALLCFEQAIQLNPNHFPARFNAGLALQEMQRYAQALEHYDVIISHNPNFAKTYINRGIVLHELGRSAEAIASYDKSIALNPNLAEAYFNKGFVLTALQKLDEALLHYDKALTLNPDYDGAYWNKSFVLLAQGQFEQGWRLYEWRWRACKTLTPRVFEAPLWLGEAHLAGKTILLHGEQGLGDMFQFCRYTSILAQQGARIVLEVPLDLMYVLQTLPGLSMLLELGAKHPPVDYHCPLMSLPLACKTFSEQAIPATIPYLFAQPDKIAHWQARLAQMSAQHQKPRRRVGLIWSGGFRPDMPEVWGLNARRNLPFEQIAVLQDLPCDFYSLQKGEPAESELPAQKAQHWHTDNLYLVNQELHDFSDTAALLMNLDLLIAVDTSTAHLAGALGKPVWLLSRFDGCWRWLFGRTDTPWYPTMKIYRQPQAHDWTSVLKQVKADLVVWLQETVSMDR